MGNLKFRSDGTFTIVQFTDVHWTDGGEADQPAKELMEHVLAAEKPDLVMYTGDMISGKKCEDPLRAMCQVVAPANDLGIPWSVVMGNHDGEGSADNQALYEVLKEHEWCLMEAGPEDVSGIGNYVMKIHSHHGDEVRALLYGFDSGDRSPYSPPYGRWAAIKRDQIAWYIDQSEHFKQQYGQTLPSLAFFHIPIPEYNEVWDHHVCYGHKYEKICSPDYNTGLFAAMLEMGDVMGTFVGHDHTNDFIGEYMGIRLCYGRATGGYGQEFMKGARIIRLKEGVRDFDSWIRLADHSMIHEQPEHQPEGRIIMTKPDSA